MATDWNEDSSASSSWNAQGSASSAAWNEDSATSSSWNAQGSASAAWNEESASSAAWKVWIRGNPYGPDGVDFSDQLSYIKPIQQTEDSVSFTDEEIFKGVATESGASALLDDEIFIASTKNIDSVQMSDGDSYLSTGFGMGGFGQGGFG